MLPPFRVDMLAARHVHDGSLGFPASISDRKIGRFGHSGGNPGFESMFWLVPLLLVRVGPRPPQQGTPRLASGREVASLRRQIVSGPRQPARTSPSRVSSDTGLCPDPYALQPQDCDTNADDLPSQVRVTFLLSISVC